MRSEELGKMRLSECRGQTCLNYAEHEHLRRSQLGVAMRDVSMKKNPGIHYDNPPYDDDYSFVFEDPDFNDFMEDTDSID